ncbi:hypothetical protein [Curtobacterium sp. BRD11]|uniref:hypothetical protein n=1 Tax=Curtobacterium sp. BRD11 TaxID=2962581 RepID=UPI002881BFDF|nr:hypothetical protein [Curtobacterium sp. BRD11]MDT0212134.1 hypothetical protein [Curtobacterium sp. BRD11]
MSKWILVPVVLIGVVVTAYGCLHWSPLLAGLAGWATLWVATTGPSVFGRARIAPGTMVDPAEVRRYRKEHPGSTISDAVVAVAASRSSSPEQPSPAPSSPEAGPLPRTQAD